MTRDAEHTPSPQSVVVPVAWYRGDPMGDDLEIGFECDGLVFDKAVWNPLYTAAPAPSSLAGGDVDETIRTAWGGAMTVACNIAIDEQNRTNADDGPSDVLNAQGEIIRRLKAVLEIDAPYLAEVKAALSPETPARDGDKLPDGAISGTDDGQTVWLESSTGGAHRLGIWGGLSLRFEEADGSHSVRDYVDAALTPRHEAPAEGAGEVASAARALLDACYKADENSDLSDFVDGMLLTRLDKALRARSSASEAREVKS